MKNVRLPLIALLFIPLAGWVGDRISLKVALMILACLPLIGFVLSWRFDREFDWRFKASKLARVGVSVLTQPITTKKD